MQQDSDKLKFRVYVPFGGNIDLLNRCVESIVGRIGEFSSEPIPVCILNNTLVSVRDTLKHYDKCLELIPPVELQLAQECNWFIRLARENDEPFACSLHTDAELLDGAIEDLLEKYHQVKETRWAQILQFSSGIFCALNPDFFYSENIWFDAFLFPFYFMDNHMTRIVTARGWSVHTTRRFLEPLVNHEIGHYAKDKPEFRRKNELVYPHHRALYAQIWGGEPEQETIIDPFASGTIAGGEVANGGNGS
jgi:hypothetical protein